MKVEIEGEGALVAAEELRALEGVQVQVEIPDRVERGGMVAVIVTILGVTSSVIGIAEFIEKWRQKYLLSDTCSPRLEKVLIIDDQGNRLLLKSATAAQIQSILKTLEQK